MDAKWFVNVVDGGGGGLARDCLAIGPYDGDGADCFAFSQTFYPDPGPPADLLAKFDLMARAPEMAEALNQYHQVFQQGLRLPAPELDQDVAYAAFVLGGLEKERDKLKAFKDYVHKRLDEAGVPADPESPHKAQGCRIGGRLDLVLARWAALDELLALCQRLIDHRANGDLAALIFAARHAFDKASGAITTG